MDRLDFKILTGMATAEESAEYLRRNGVDPEKVVEQGIVFVKTVQQNIAFKNQIEQMYDETEVVKICNALYSAMTTDSTYDGVWLDEWFEKNLKKSK
jgi:hypothetical protein